MDIPNDLSGMSNPVPHYRDIKRTNDNTARDRLYRAIGTAINVATVLAIIRFGLWAIDHLVRWHP